MKRAILLGAITLSLVSTPAFSNQNKNSRSAKAGIKNDKDGTYLKKKRTAKRKSAHKRSATTTGTKNGR